MPKIFVIPNPLHAHKLKKLFFLPPHRALVSFELVTIDFKPCTEIFFSTPAASFHPGWSIARTGLNLTAAQSSGQT